MEARLLTYQILLTEFRKEVEVVAIWVCILKKACRTLQPIG